MCILLRESALRRNAYFSKFRFPSFLQCVFYHLRHGRQKITSQGARNQGFWDLLAHSGVQGARNFLFGMRHKIAVFYHVLSVSVVPSVSVESAMESNEVLNDVFLRCVIERHTSSGDASFEPAVPSIADFLEHLTAACPCSVIHSSRKCPQFCGLGRSWMLNELSAWSRFSWRRSEILLCGSHRVVRRLENTCDFR